MRFSTAPSDWMRIIRPVSPVATSAQSRRTTLIGRHPTRIDRPRIKRVDRHARRDQLRRKAQRQSVQSSLRDRVCHLGWHRPLILPRCHVDDSASTARAPTSLAEPGACPIEEIDCSVRATKVEFHTRTLLALRPARGRLPPRVRRASSPR